jgi:ubiquinone/menaquinone biosynthesis C-methylase UbiE
MADDAQRLIEWTGERCVPWADEVQGIYEHLHRYHFATSFAAGKQLLELASGEGYGAAILAQHAAHVTAIDIDHDSIAHSRTTYDLPNLEFVEGSMLDLGSFEDAAFDVVVCFEALEHVREHDELIGGAARVLRPDGLLVLSTPDRDTYNAQIVEPNPFHMRELSRSELLDLLQRHFQHVSLWGQSGIGGSRLALLDGPGRPELREELLARRDGTWIDLEDAPTPFVLAVASGRPLPDAPGRAYLIDPTSEALRERDLRVAARDAQIRELKEKNAALYRDNERLRRRRLRHRLKSAVTRLAGGSR